jgi:hypothetical protein
MLGKKFDTCGGGVKGEARRGGRGGNRRRQMEEEKWEGEGEIYYQEKRRKES